MTLWRWLLSGSDELVLPKTWLADTHRLAQYEAYTKRQWQQGSVVKTAKETGYDAFWQAVEAKRQRKSADVLKLEPRQHPRRVG